MKKKPKKAAVVKPAVLVTDEFAAAKQAQIKFAAEMKKAERLLTKHRVIFECIKALRPGFKLFVLNTFGSLRIVIGCRVTAMAEIQPVLELLEKHLAVTFDGSTDDAQLKWRSFTTTKLPWFRVDAEIADESESCKQVIVGYETVPKYELKCD